MINIYFDNITDKEVQEFTNELQKIMRLRDWDIITQMVDADKMKALCNHRSHWGMCARQVSCKQAYIYINSEVDCPDRYGWRGVVAHEMFHILLGRFIDWVEAHVDAEKEPDYVVTMEQSVSLSARALLRSLEYDGKIIPKEG